MFDSIKQIREQMNNIEERMDSDRKSRAEIAGAFSRINLSAFTTTIKGSVAFLRDVFGGIPAFIDNNSSIRIFGQAPEYTIGGLPSAVGYEGMTVYVSDATGGDDSLGAMRYSDGVTWRRYDRTAYNYSSLAAPIASDTLSNLGSPSNSYVLAWVTDGRKSGEGAGAGTGVLAIWDGSNWLNSYDLANVAT